MSVTGKERREVPLPSQEGKKGVMQYALYVLLPLTLNSVTVQEELVAQDGIWQSQLRSEADSKPEQLSTK
jgi:NADH dehydrogenase (ubiquinone) Fe-S protein 7